MAEPVCPEGWECKFTRVEPEHVGPWWEGAGGSWITVLAILAVVVIVCWTVWYWYEASSDQRERRARHEEREHKQAMAEQFTAQIDMAKGDDEMLKIVQEQQRVLR